MRVQEHLRVADCPRPRRPRYVISVSNGDYPSDTLGAPSWYTTWDHWTSVEPPKKWFDRNHRICKEIVFGQQDPKIIPDCHRIRKEVFHVEQGIPLETEYDDLDDVACHFLLRVTELDSVTGERIVKSVGTIRGVAPDAYPSMQRYKLSRLAIDKDYRKHRFGRLLVESLHKWIADDAKAKSLPVEIECHSHLATINFYAKFGYTVEGPQSLNTAINVVLQHMILRLPIPEEDSFRDREPLVNE